MIPDSDQWMAPYSVSLTSICSLRMVRVTQSDKPVSSWVYLFAPRSDPIVLNQYSLSTPFPLLIWRVVCIDSSRAVCIASAPRALPAVLARPFISSAAIRIRRCYLGARGSPRVVLWATGISSGIYSVRCFTPFSAHAPAVTDVCFFVAGLVTSDISWSGRADSSYEAGKVQHSYRIGQIECACVRKRLLSGTCVVDQLQCYIVYFCVNAFIYISVIKNKILSAKWCYRATEMGFLILNYRDVYLINN